MVSRSLSLDYLEEINLLGEYQAIVFEVEAISKRILSFTKKSAGIS